MKLNKSNGLVFQQLSEAHVILFLTEGFADD